MSIGDWLIFILIICNKLQRYGTIQRQYIDNCIGLTFIKQSRYLNCTEVRYRCQYKYYVCLTLSFGENHIFELYFNKNNFYLERWIVFRNKTLKSLYSVLAIHQLHSWTIYHKRRGRRGRDRWIYIYLCN